MDKDQILNLGIGTEAAAKLEAKPVKIVSLDTQPHDFGGKNTDQLIVMVVHPDKPEPFQIYNVSYQKGNVIKTVGFSLYYDSKGQLLQGTAPAELMRTYKISNLGQLQGMSIPTVMSPKGFLSLKAY